MGEPLNNQCLVKKSKTGISLQSQSCDSVFYLQNAYPHKTQATEPSLDSILYIQYILLDSFLKLEEQQLPQIKKKN